MISLHSCSVLHRLFVLACHPSHRCPSVHLQPGCLTVLVQLPPDIRPTRDQYDRVQDTVHVGHQLDSREGLCVLDDCLCLVLEDGGEMEDEGGQLEECGCENYYRVSERYAADHGVSCVPGCSL